MGYIHRMRPEWVPSGPVTNVNDKGKRTKQVWFSQDHELFGRIEVANCFTLALANELVRRWNAMEEV